MSLNRRQQDAKIPHESEVCCNTCTRAKAAPAAMIWVQEHGQTDSDHNGCRKTSVERNTDAMTGNIK